MSTDSPLTRDECATMILLALAGISLGVTLGVYIMGSLKEELAMETQPVRAPQGRPLPSFVLWPDSPPTQAQIRLGEAVAAFLRNGGAGFRELAAGIARSREGEIPTLAPIPDAPAEPKEDA